MNRKILGVEYNATRIEKRKRFHPKPPTQKKQLLLQYTHKCKHLRHTQSTKTQKSKKKKWMEQRIKCQAI